MWKKIIKQAKKQYKKIKTVLANSLLDKEENRRIVCLSVYFLLGFVSCVMTILNILTHKGMLTLATGLFAGLCALNVVLSKKGKKAVKLASVLFSVEILVLFSFFLITGNPDGFSAIWICMLPSLGMLAFGMTHCSILCTAMLAELLVLFWVRTPFIEIYPYNETFRMRFPVLFLAFWAVSILLEILRENTFRQMKKLQNRINEMSAHDPLSNLYNRRGMYQAFADSKERQTASKISVLLFDIDKFKHFNDTYGHSAGDAIIQGFSALMDETLHHSIACRWGGEEFIAIWFDDAVSEDDIQHFGKAVSEYEFHHEDQTFRITVSAGLYETELTEDLSIDECIGRADEAMYRAKQSGRNCLRR